MPFESESKLSNESGRTHHPWWTKCLPTLSVRDKHRPPDDPIRLVMTADSPKKRKREFSPLPGRKVPLQIGKSKTSNMEVDTRNVRDIFDEMITRPGMSEEYNKSHNELTQKEEANAWDRDARPEATSTLDVDVTEKQAACIIQALREYERRVTFGNLPSEAIPGPETLDMGGQFLTNKYRIDTCSKLFKIAQDVPKGALLHLHFNAELSPELLLKQAEGIDNMYIRSVRPLLSEEDLSETEMVFSVLGPSDVEENVNIFSSEYPGNATNWKQDEWKRKVWMKWSAFQKGFINTFPKADRQEATIAADGPHRICCANPQQPALSPAETWLKSKMVLSLEEAYGPNQTVNGVWARFNQATRCFKGLLNYEKVYKWYIGEAIDKLIDERVMYAELRPMLLDKSIPTNDGTKKISNADQMRLIIECVETKKRDLEAAGILDKFPFGFKIIYCTPRSIPKKMMQEELKQCIELKEQFPDLICGFDLVGAEDRPNHIGHYKEELVAFKDTCKAKGFDIPFLFHAGETLLDTGGSSDPRNSNLYDAVVLGAERIGHGFSLMKHPQMVVDKFKRTKDSKGICVELCPISNELLHLCRNIKEHPFPEFLAAGVPCTINSDNPSLFSNSMSHEFYQVMVGAPTMTLYSWKQLARWSIEYSYLSPGEKERAYAILDKDWHDFCKDVVNKYWGLVDSNVLDEEETKVAKEKMLQGSDKKLRLDDVQTGSISLDSLFYLWPPCQGKACT